MTTAFDQGHCPSVELRHRMRIAREYAGYDSGELADIIGVSRNTIGNAESGRVKVRTIVINAWAMACGVPKSWLITGKAPEDSPDGGCGLGIIRRNVQVAASKNRSSEEERKRA
jgi:DNA-binding XRE family transcriptional regulator